MKINDKIYCFRKVITAFLAVIIALSITFCFVFSSLWYDFDEDGEVNANYDKFEDLMNEETDSGSFVDLAQNGIVLEQTFDVEKTFNLLSISFVKNPDFQQDDFDSMCGAKYLIELIDESGKTVFSHIDDKFYDASYHGFRFSPKGFKKETNFTYYTLKITPLDIGAQSKYLIRCIDKSAASQTAKTTLKLNGEAVDKFALVSTGYLAYHTNVPNIVCMSIVFVIEAVLLVVWLIILAKIGKNASKSVESKSAITFLLCLLVIASVIFCFAYNPQKSEVESGNALGNYLYSDTLSYETLEDIALNKTSLEQTLKVNHKFNVLYFNKTENNDYNSYESANAKYLLELIDENGKTVLSKSGTSEEVFDGAYFNTALNSENKEVTYTVKITPIEQGVQSKFVLKSSNDKQALIYTCYSPIKISHFIIPKIIIICVSIAVLLAWLIIRSKKRKIKSA